MQLCQLVSSGVSLISATEVWLQEWQWLTSFTELQPAMAKSVSHISFQRILMALSLKHHLWHNPHRRQSLYLLIFPFSYRGFHTNLPYRLVPSCWCPRLHNLPTWTGEWMWQSTLLTHRQHGLLREKSTLPEREEPHVWVQDILC